ncbi:MAG: C/D box methylation guide ribonucleoprotein complex aNOP56 subunit [Candidatus Altiarchaeota archaeon]|nr:C/D box methylation guide ribonucleoprotein complex aNOP56 subunit [Candidatus Altiarchaeota archaeon]
MMRLTTNVLGSFVLETNRIIKQNRFPDDVDLIAKKMREVEESVCAEERELLKWLGDTGNNKVLVKNPPRFYSKGFKITFAEDKERVDLYKICDDIGYDSSRIEELIRKVNRLLTREKLKVVEKDQLLIQAVKSLDDIDEAINRLIERLRDWYSLHYPELDYLMENHETYAKLVCDLGSRDSFSVEKLAMEPNYAKKIADSAKNSLGMGFNEADITAVKELSENIINLYKLKKNNEEYLKSLMEEIAPNINALVGPTLGARVIALAGGLKRLSILPAGTIQVLGAEDAFFRFLKTGKKPPKHGIIFQLPEIRGSKKQLRGKIARSIAAKIALASRSDRFKGSFIGDRLRKGFDERVKNLR